MESRPTRILVFLSEILSAKTLAPIIGALRSDGRYLVRIVNDGFCRDFIESLELPIEFIIDDFESRIDQIVRDVSIVLMGKSYVQPSEYILLRAASRHRVQVLLVVPDMGIDVVRAKLKGICEGNAQDIPWPTLLLADPRTRDSLCELGVPNSRVKELGNPYFDELYRNLNQDRTAWMGQGIGYFSTPFELDFQRGILPTDYKQKELIADIRDVASSLSLPLVGKRHPQVDLALFDGMSVFDGTPLDLIRTIRVAVGSYSTTLLESFASGIPTISYQPWKSNIREDVFAGRIQITKTKNELKQALDRATKGPSARRNPTVVTFHPSKSIDIAMQVIEDAARKA